MGTSRRMTYSPITVEISLQEKIAEMMADITTDAIQAITVVQRFTRKRTLAHFTFSVIELIRLTISE